MFDEGLNQSLSMFDFLHLITLTFIILMFIIIYIFKNKLSSTKNEKLFRIILGILLLVFELGFHVWIFSKGHYAIDMIPLTGFCAFTNLITVFVLLTNKPQLFNYIIYYALTGSMFALIFVDMSYRIPHFRYFHYFIVHSGFLLASFYYLITNRLTISFKNYFKASLYLFCYTIIVLIVNIILKKNWFYLFENPVKEISEAIGNPWYTILWILTIIILTYLWYLLLNLIKNKNLFSKVKWKLQQNNSSQDLAAIFLLFMFFNVFFVFFNNFFD